MSKPANILQISPADLYFPPPLNRVIACILRLHNPTENEYVAFKVKTTAPKRYCVRPNNGVVEPGQTTEVQILLQAMQNPEENLKSKDKFLVQSVKITSDQVADKDAVWSGIKPDQFMEHKLRCHFTSPSDVRTPGANKSTASPSAVATPENNGIGTPRASSTPQGNTASEPAAKPASSTAAPVSQPVAAEPKRSSLQPSSETSISATASGGDASKIKKLEDAILNLTADRERLRTSLEKAAHRMEQDRKSSGANAAAGSSGFSLSSVLIIAFLVLIIGVLLGALGGGPSSSILK
eukprot:TRINITY_DN9360_c0_g1_i3.p1 TRINITY_DN9360_c0_g1~~TRINITY_DN9360_c0_g1_i3.p1  ORF type:complete len:295 (+),score=79.54 TRINITY_DN9360_c0_g1_i3:297-1181(+)